MSDRNNLKRPKVVVSYEFDKSKIIYDKLRNHIQHGQQYDIDIAVPLASRPEKFEKILKELRKDLMAMQPGTASQVEESSRSARIAPRSYNEFVTHLFLTEPETAEIGIHHRAATEEPPKTFLTKLALIVVPADHIERAFGDIEETYRSELIMKEGKKFADAWYRTQMLKLAIYSITPMLLKLIGLKELFEKWVK